LKQKPLFEAASPGAISFSLSRLVLEIHYIVDVA
jgi:membrane-associated phospholipid phosphatase